MVNGESEAQEFHGGMPMWRFLNLRALIFAAVITLLLIAAIVVGSRNLQNFDAALVAYLLGTTMACSFASQDLAE
jgi:hypothetical protein